MSMVQEPACGTWDGLPDDVLVSIVSLTSPSSLRNLARVERRCRQPCSARLGYLAAPLLHEMACAGDMARISRFFHDWRGAVLLQSDGHTILHTAIEARRHDLIQWLVQPLSTSNRYSPLSSLVIHLGNHVAEELVPRPLPEEYCLRLMLADGVPALRAAAESGDLELLDRLLPLGYAHLPISPASSRLVTTLGPTRELMIELRDSLLRRARTVLTAAQEAAAENIDGAAVNRALRITSAAQVIDGRVRCSDIRRIFEHGVGQIDELFVRYQAEPHLGVGALFGWHWQGDFLEVEMKYVNDALGAVVAEGRIDLAGWLIDSWSAQYESHTGETLADLALVSPWYEVHDLFAASGKDKDKDGFFLPMVLERWHNREPVPPHWEVGSVDPMRLAELQVAEMPPRACDSAALATSLKAVLAYIAREERLSPLRDKRCLKRMLARVEPHAGHPAMLDYLLAHGLGQPRLAVVACSGAAWALDWLMARGLLALDTPTSDVATELRHGLHAAAPWLTQEMARRMPVGPVLAAVCASHGALALLERLAHLGVDLRTRFRRKRTLLHMAARACQTPCVIWLVENGYADLLRCSSRGRASDAAPFRHCGVATCTSSACRRRCSSATPLHDAIAGGDAELVLYLLARGGAASDPARDGREPLWEELALLSPSEAVREIAVTRRSQRVLDMTLPHLLRSGAALETIQPLMASSSVRDLFAWNRAHISRVRALLQAAVDGERSDFIRWLYEPSGQESPLFMADHGICGVAAFDEEHHMVKHVDILRQLLDATSAPRLSALVDELEEQCTVGRASAEELHKLNDKFKALVTAGGAVEEVVAVVAQIDLMRAASSSAAEGCASVHGMTLQCNEVRGKEWVVQFRVEGIGRFPLFTAVAMHGHTHLMHWLLQGRDPPTLAQVVDALATCLNWAGATCAVELLCRHLQERDVDLSTVQRAVNPEHPNLTREVGAMEYALNGIRHSFYFLEKEYRVKRVAVAWDNARWLVAHTQTRLGEAFFPNLLSDSAFSRHNRALDERCSEEEDTAGHAIVLELTRFCVATLGVSWSARSANDRNSGQHHNKTMIQLLINGYWMDAVAWLAKEHGVPLQGLVIEEQEFCSPREREHRRAFRDRLQALQEEQRLSWAHVGVA